MSLPLNINDLLTGHVVEWDRLEFKEGWNPLEAMQAICAFANDFHNWGGGYLVFGIGEQGGRPQLPPAGLTQAQVDEAQRKLLELGHRLQPHYHPICEPVVYQNKLVLVVWVPGGEMRPYKAPRSLAAGKAEMAYFIRMHANTIQAKGELEQELISLANRVPFDDRQNLQASPSDLKPGLIRSFLSEVGSDLAKEAFDLEIEDLGQRLQIVRGPAEQVHPLNVGLMFFTSEPSKWFPQTQIDVVHMPRGPGGDTLIEKTFTGPLSSMLRDALAYLKNQFVTEYVRKHADREEAERYYNLPYAALEETIANAVYHRSYEEREPIEVRITPEEVTVLSFPGPDRSINMEDLRAGRAVARRYRNRRIGEFLKELDLTEGRSTGIPKILQAMAANGSDEPSFETDPDRTSFLVRLPVRKKPVEQESDDPGPDRHQVGTNSAPSRKGEAHEAHVANKTRSTRDQVGTKSGLSQKQVEVMYICLQVNSLKDIMTHFRRANRSKFRDQVIKPLLEAGFLEMTRPDTPTSRLQAYRTTDAGRQALSQDDLDP